MVAEEGLFNTVQTDMREMAPLIQINHFRNVYYPTVAVSDISISIQKGDIFALVGANGAGKSTLIKMLSGVVSCDAGEMLFDTKSVNLSHYNPMVARNLGIRVVHQNCLCARI
jgi:ABC-type sugar transport system ATPase subunit